jgi:ABC-type sugar transport system ATPase subunit
MSRPLAGIRLHGITTRTGPRPCVEDVSVHVRFGEFLAFLGPPRSGKSALLASVAGLRPRSAGRVLVDGEDVSAVAPGRRGIGLVAQEGALWPHVTAAQHVAFGLEQRGMARGDVAAKVSRVLARLGLADVADRRPAGLDTDERRRLALARAVAVEPRVLLLDEPLAHLDPVHRKALRIEVAKLHRDLAVTTICATRDAADALALSDRLAVIVDGRVVQSGEPEGVYQQPVSRAAAEALGPANFLPVRVEVPSTADFRIFRLGDRVRVEVSSETVALVPADGP